ncbi:MAG TPA: aromatic amino acid ammonia-lyase, partial [Ohtaekwangia sp.]|uniref:aromatic amino acid ammonia-lyase n=1 Tax=Ohtaekwangia sp. TaxID=2066019 RepID=UPI002F9509F0
MSVHFISDKKLTLHDLSSILTGEKTVQLSEEAKRKIIQCREYLDQKLATSHQPIYGINTGFGSLYNRNISHDQLEKLQENLVKSHACGTGPEVPGEIVKLMLFLKAQSLAYGYSGVQLVTTERLLDMYNHNVLPVIYEMGSLGASGDLAPLAHLSLPMLGLGEVYIHRERKTGEEINKQFNWPAIHFQAKEGLALLNGTQFMSAYGTWCILHAHRIKQLANIIG